jgi:hypothetical protein
MRTLELTDPDLYARIALLLGKLHGESLLISQIKEYQITRCVSKTFCSLNNRAVARFSVEKFSEI